MKGQGCEELYANVSAIITFMTDKRREEQKPLTTKKSTEGLEETRAAFAFEVWRTYGAFGPSEILIVDEIAINFDMPGTSGRCLIGEHVEARMTDNGCTYNSRECKLGGRIETNEL
ncbi:hypothetical protein PInf_007625 [Phytophthora infestans]|nr:hypothetical protein PInf_007625 [Phytophthora infestans]